MNNPNLLIHREERRHTHVEFFFALKNTHWRPVCCASWAPCSFRHSKACTHFGCAKAHADHAAFWRQNLNWRKFAKEKKRKRKKIRPPNFCASPPSAGCSDAAETSRNNDTEFARQCHVIEQFASELHSANSRRCVSVAAVVVVVDAAVVAA